MKRTGVMDRIGIKTCDYGRQTERRRQARRRARRRAFFLAAAELAAGISAKHRFVCAELTIPSFCFTINFSVVK